MRLRRVETEHPLTYRFVLRMIRLVARVEPPDVLKLLFHRPDFFGGAMGRYVQAVLRGPSEWSVGERELMAALTARAQGSAFFAGAHAAIASYLLGEAAVAAVLAGDPAAPVSDQFRAARVFLDKLTLRPGEVGPDDARAVLAAGVSPTGLADVAHVVTAFAALARCAGALDFRVPTAAEFARGVPELLKRGY